MTAGRDKPGDKRRRRTGLRPWLFHEIVRRSPVLRSDLIAEARKLGIIKNDDRGPSSLRTALLRLDAEGLIAFDRKRAWWCGRSIPVRAIPEREWHRLHRLAKGDRAAFERMRDEELARLQAKKEAALWALRSGDVATFQPPPVGPQRRSWKVQSNDRIRAAIGQLWHGPLQRALDRARAGLPPLPEEPRC